MQFNEHTNDTVDTVLKSVKAFLLRLDGIKFAILGIEEGTTLSRDELCQMAKECQSALDPLALCGIPQLLRIRLEQKLKNEDGDKNNRADSSTDCYICQESVYPWNMIEASCQECHFCHIDCMVTRVYEDFYMFCPGRGCREPIKDDFPRKVLDDVLNGFVCRALREEGEKNDEKDNLTLVVDRIIAGLSTFYQGLKAQLPPPDADIDIGFIPEHISEEKRERIFRDGVSKGLVRLEGSLSHLRIRFPELK